MLSELVSDSHDKISVDELTLSVLLSGFYEVGNPYTAKEEAFVKGVRAMNWIRPSFLSRLSC